MRVVFDDRTIVRLQRGQDAVKILSRSGEELVFSLSGMGRNQLAQKYYQNYVQVATEFFDWIFLTKAEQEVRQREEASKEMAVSSEIDRI